MKGNEGHHYQCIGSRWLRSIHWHAADADFVPAHTIGQPACGLHVRLVGAGAGLTRVCLHAQAGDPNHAQALIHLLTPLLTSPFKEYLTPAIDAALHDMLSQVPPRAWALQAAAPGALFAPVFCSCPACLM